MSLPEISFFSSFFFKSLLTHQEITALLVSINNLQLKVPLPVTTTSFCFCRHEQGRDHKSFSSYFCYFLLCNKTLFATPEGTLLIVQKDEPAARRQSKMWTWQHNREFSATAAKRLLSRRHNCKCTYAVPTRWTFWTEHAQLCPRRENRNYYRLFLAAVTTEQVTGTDTAPTYTPSRLFLPAVTMGAGHSDNEQ